jgi:hypothetical protein
MTPETYPACIEVDGEKLELGEFGFAEDAMAAVNYAIAYLGLPRELEVIPEGVSPHD